MSAGWRFRRPGSDLYTLITRARPPVAYNSPQAAWTWRSPTMFDQSALITYLAVLTGFVFIPGPAVLMTLARSASSGTRVGVATGSGIAVGDLAHTVMAVLGLSALLLASAVLFNIIKYIGAAYLVYLGIRD